MSTSSQSNAVAGNSAQSTAGPVKNPSIAARYKALCLMVTPSLVEAGRGLPLKVSQKGRQAIIWAILAREYGQDAVDVFARGEQVPAGWSSVDTSTEDSLTSTAEIVRALAGMTPYGEDGDGDDAKEVLNRLIGFAQRGTGALDEPREVLYETSEDISSALLWLADINAPDHERIAGAISCLRRHQDRRAAVNRETDAMRATLAD